MSLTESTPREAASAGAHASASQGAGPRPSNAPRRKGVRVDRKMGPNSFVPRKSSPFYERTLKLHSLMAQQLFESTYGRTQVALYNVRYLAPILADEATARELGQTVKTMLDAVSTEVQDTIAQLQIVRQQKGAKNVATFSDPHEVTVAWFTPSTNAYLTLVEAFDELMSEVETLWMLEHFDDDQKKNMGYEWRNRLVRFARSLIELQGRSLAAVRRKLDKNAPRAAVPAAIVEAAEAQAAATPADSLVAPGDLGEHVLEPQAKTDLELAGIIVAPEPVVALRDIPRVTGVPADKPARAPRVAAVAAAPIAAAG